MNCPHCESGIEELYERSLKVAGGEHYQVFYVCPECEKPLETGEQRDSQFSA